MTIRLTRRAFAATLPALVLPAGRAATDDALALLRQGGAAVLLRHAATEAGIGDPPGFRLGDCRTQRNLSADGRAQATRIGEWFRRHGLRPAPVRSSRWCRCVDTARLAFPRHEVLVFEALNSFFADGSTRAAQTEALRGFLARLPPRRRVVLVTHHVNIAALTGQAVGMGEALLVRTGDGAGELAGRLRFA